MQQREGAKDRVEEGPNKARKTKRSEGKERMGKDNPQKRKKKKK